MKIRIVWLSTALLIGSTAIAASLWQTHNAELHVLQSRVESTASSNASERMATPHAGMRPVVETKTKLINYTVMNPKYEKHQKQVNYTVMKPVYETKEKTVTYTVCTMVPETKTKTIEYTTCRMVPETKQKVVEYQEVRYVPIDGSNVEPK